MSYLIIKMSDSYQIRNTENIRPDIKNAESYIRVEGEYYDFSIGLACGYCVIPKEENIR